ncbi:uncharacterized protein LOC126667362 [Mercurialis annua]|uniref:uncharacterized protein LOC126667362 n=1 Tax=Mercurialis annua TaxID=3986 RepID=UPI002160692B|nr:uncharacterized protein LOC126667362 [Mercurialis annua]
MVRDHWVRTAMTDDTVVVELLVRLKQSQAAPSSKIQPVIPFKWGLRLPRSKSVSSGAAVASSSLRCEHDVVSRRKDGESSTRCSPTTPLSWSGGAGGGSADSPSGDGFEETSRHVSRSCSPGVRSKATAETGSTTNSGKRSRKKKTFAELRLEEGLLMEEKMHLKKEIATLNATFKEHRSRNKNLKRIKLDLNMQYSKNSGFASDELEEAICSQSHISMIFAKGDDNTQSGSCETHEAVSDHDSSFLLPDLNMMPSD